jgi:trk system potassium uptake protein
VEEVKREFRIEEICMKSDSEWAGKTLADLDLRRRHNITVIGIKRGEEKIVSPIPGETVQPGDTLVVLGHPESIRLYRDTFACEKIRNPIAE